MDKNKLSQISTIIIVGIMIALVGTVAVTKIVKNKPTTTSPSVSQSDYHEETPTTSPAVSKETVPMSGNSVITTVTGQKPQWKVEEEASVSASIAQSKSESSKKAQQKTTTKPQNKIVPVGRANIIAAYEKGVNNLKKTKKMNINEESRHNITVNDITGGYLVKETTEALISQFMTSEPKSYRFRDGEDTSTGHTPNEIIPPFNKALKLSDSAVYSASAKATADGGYTVTIRLKDEKQTVSEVAENHEAFSLPIYPDEILSSGLPVENYELYYSGTTITVLFDRNNRITYLEHFVSAPTTIVTGNFSFVPFEMNLNCNYIAKYDITY